LGSRESGRCGERRFYSKEMKVFCFGDVHIGASRHQFVREEEDCLGEWVLGCVKRYGCERVVFLGDFFKERMHTGRDKDKVWHLLKEISKVVDVVVVAGNHDYYDKNCEESAVEVFSSDGIEVASSCVMQEEVGGRKILYVPWKWVFGKGVLDGDVIFGHFELAEAVSWQSEEQVNLQNFRNARVVVSGHLHFRKRIGNVYYAGVPFQRSFGDGLEGGGAVVDLESLKVEFVNGYGVKFVEVESIEDLKKLDGIGRCYIRVRERNLLKVVEEYEGDIVGFEYLPSEVCSGSEDLMVLQDVKRKIDVWELLGEYGEKVLKLDEKGIEWLKGVVNEVK